MQNGGHFNSGIELFVQPTGTIAIDGGPTIQNADLTVEGGQFTGSSNGILNLAAGTGSWCEVAATRSLPAITRMPQIIYRYNRHRIDLFQQRDSHSRRRQLRERPLRRQLDASVALVGGSAGTGAVTVDGVGSKFNASLLAVGQSAAAST